MAIFYTRKAIIFDNLPAMRYPIVVVPFMKSAGMALFPFVLVNNSRLLTDKQLIRHEQIHLRQQAELLVLPFYILYLLNYLVNLAIYKNHNQAYMHIIFEREAYGNEHDAEYLAKRKVWAWMKA
jgi:hypothetical protein